MVMLYLAPGSVSVRLSTGSHTSRPEYCVRTQSPITLDLVLAESSCVK